MHDHEQTTRLADQPDKDTAQTDFLPAAPSQPAIPPSARKVVSRSLNALSLKPLHYSITPCPPPSSHFA